MKTSRKLVSGICVLALVGALGACSTPSGKAEASDSITYDSPVVVKNCGQETTLTRIPTKVVSMGVTGLAYLLAAGGENNVIGRANEWGEQAASWMGKRADSIPVITDDALSIEGLMSVKPDLVYGGGFDSAGLSPSSVADKGIPAIVDSSECHYFYPDQTPDESFTTILREITQLGRILGTEDAAQKTVQDLQTRIAEIKNEQPGHGERVSYAYYFGEDDGLFSYGEQGVIGDINKTLGIRSAIDPNYHPHQGPLAPEVFVKSDPDMIIILTGMGGATKESTLKRLEKIPGYGDMKAVKNNRIYYAESAVAYASPSAIYGTIDLAQQLKK
ncbi:ABC transporter substrate-binding protein [Arcanobacterium phocae]|uniref:ABC transporter substrate-binding protein n=1 Tax=Arcanobacterium phocae TaxID=131112 RepID=UPI001C0E9A8B|nr:ABC transporter substrate-binding protein [Arcanobacterium phocae]